MQIQILGPSSADCLRLEMLVRQILAEFGMHDAQVRRLSTPGGMGSTMWGGPIQLIVDRQLIWSGGKQLPTKDRLRDSVREAILMPA